MVNGEPPHTRSFSDKMKRYLGDIDNAVYKAEQVCITHKESCLGVCPFNSWKPGDKMFKRDWGLCQIKRLRETLGEHFEQHDITVSDIDSHAADVMK